MKDGDPCGRLLSLHSNHSLTLIPNRARERLEQSALLVIQMGGQRHRDLGLEIAALIWLAQLRHTLPAQAEGFAVGRLWRDAQREPASIGCGYVCLAA